jgi:hypothetical protein
MPRWRAIISNVPMLFAGMPEPRCRGATWGRSTPCGHRWPPARTEERISVRPLTRSDSGPQLLEDLGGLREVAHPVLVPEQLAVPLDDEVAPPAGDQLDGGFGELVLDLGAQTGRPRFVVSDDAVFDADVHAPAGYSGSVSPGV